MQIVVDSHGQVRCVYSESIDLAALGDLTIHRGSHVEPDERGQWFADLCPTGGPSLGPFMKRSEALAAEQAWLEEHWLLEHISATTRAPQRKDHHGTHDPLRPEDLSYSGR